MMTPTQLRSRLIAAGIKRAYETGAVPALPAGGYVVFSFGAGDPSTYSLAGGSDSRHTITVQIFAQSLDGLLDLAGRADAALREVYLSEIPGEPFCIRALATRPGRDPDAEGWLYVLHAYQYGDDHA